MQMHSQHLSDACQSRRKTLVWDTRYGEACVIRTAPAPSPAGRECRYGGSRRRAPSMPQSPATGQLMCEAGPHNSHTANIFLILVIYQIQVEEGAVNGRQCQQPALSPQNVKITGTVGQDARHQRSRLDSVSSGSSLAHIGACGVAIIIAWVRKCSSASPASQSGLHGGRPL